MAYDGILSIGLNVDSSQLTRTLNQLGGNSSRAITQSINAQSQALGRITGQASDFSKSMAASNARVLAFGMSTGAIYALGNAFRQLVRYTIDVEREMVELNSVFQLGARQLKSFSNDLFAVANSYGMAFSEAVKAATEFSRQGLNTEETIKRTSAALALGRISGMGMEKAVSSLTSILNTFTKEALASEDVINRLISVDQSYAISAGEIAEALGRVSSSAVDANVSLNQTVALITATKQITSRSAAVIGNSWKTIFTRLARPEVIEDLESIGVHARDSQGKIRPMIDILTSLASSYDTLTTSQKSFITETVGSLYQVNILKGILRDLGSGTSIFTGALNAASNSTDLVNKRMEMLNETMSSQLIRTANNLKQAFANIGTALLTSSMKSGLGNFNKLIQNVGSITDPINTKEGSPVATGGANVVQGALKGFGNILKGPGLQLATQAILILFQRLGRYVTDAGSELLGINKSEKERLLLDQNIAGWLKTQHGTLAQILNGQLSINDAKKQYVEYVRNADAIEKTRSRVGTAIGGIAISEVHPVIKSLAGGFVPNLESESARRGGYNAGRVFSTMINNGPEKIRAVVNSAEQMSQVTHGGKTYTFINPPISSPAGRVHRSTSIDRTGVDPYALPNRSIGQIGFVPNLATGLYHRDVGFPSHIQSQLSALNGISIPLIPSAHARSAMFDDIKRHGNKVVPVPRQLSINSSEIFEAEYDSTKRGFGGTNIQKLALRRQGGSGLDQSIVILPNGVIKTIWHNSAGDQHGTLDKTKYSTMSMGFVPNLANYNENLQEHTEKLESKGWALLGEGAESRAFRKGNLVFKMPLYPDEAEYKNPRKAIVSMGANKVFQSMGLEGLKAARVRLGNVEGSSGLLQRYAGTTLGTIFSELSTNTLAEREKKYEILDSLLRHIDNKARQISHKNRMVGDYVLGIDTGSSHNFTVGNPGGFKNLIGNIVGRAPLEKIHSNPKLMSILLKAGQLKAIDLGGYKSGGFIPNLANPVSDALSRENRATGGHAVLGSHPLLRSIFNPLGLAAYDRSSQRDVGDAIGQHMQAGDNLNDIRKRRASHGFVPNLAVFEPENIDKSSGMFSSNALTSSVGLAVLSGLQGRLAEPSESADKRRSWAIFKPFLSEMEASAIKLRSLNRELEKAKSDLVSGKTVSTSLGSKYYTQAQGPQMEAEFGKVMAPLQEKYEKYLRQKEEERARYGAHARTISIGTAFAGGMATQIAESLGPTFGAATNEFSNSLTQASQILMAFPSKVGAFFAVSTAIAGGISAFEVWTKGLHKARQTFDIANTKYQKLSTGIDGLSASLNQYDSMISDATVSFEAIEREQRKYSESLAQMTQFDSTSEGFRIATKLAGAPDTQSKMKILMEERDRATRRMELGAGTLAIREYAGNRTFAGSKYLGVDPLGYSNESQRNKLEQTSKGMAGAVVSNMSDSLKTTLTNAKSVQEFTKSLDYMASTSEESAILLKNAFTELSDNLGGPAVDKLRSLVINQLQTEKSQNTPQRIEAQKELRRANTERQLQVDSALNQAKTSQRLFINSGSLRANNTLDIRALFNQMKLSEGMVGGPDSIARRQGSAALYRLQYGERTVRQYEAATEMRRIALERDAKVNQINTDVTRNVVGTLTQNFESKIKNPELYRNAGMPGSSVPTIGDFNVQFLESLNKGISTSVAGGNLTRFKGPNGQIDTQGMMRSIAGASSTDKQMQSNVYRYLQANTSFDIMKSLLDSTNQIVNIDQEALSSSQKEAISLQSAIKELDFKRLANVMGGIKNVTDRDSRRQMERDIVRGTSLMNNPRATAEARAKGADMYLKALAAIGAPTDLSGKTQLSREMIKAKGLILSGTEVVQRQSLERMIGSTGRLTGFGSSASLALREYSRNLSPAQREAAFNKEYLPENAGIAAGSKLDISQSTDTFNTNLSNSSMALFSFAESINTSKERMLKDLQIAIDVQKKLGKETDEANRKFYGPPQGTGTTGNASPFHGDNLWDKTMGSMGGVTKYGIGTALAGAGMYFGGKYLSRSIGKQVAAAMGGMATGGTKFDNIINEKLSTEMAASIRAMSTTTTKFNRSGGIPQGALGGLSSYLGRLFSKPSPIAGGTSQVTPIGWNVAGYSASPTSTTPANAAGMRSYLEKLLSKPSPIAGGTSQTLPLDITQNYVGERARLAAREASAPTIPLSLYKSYIRELGATDPGRKGRLSQIRNAFSKFSPGTKMAGLGLGMMLAAPTLQASMGEAFGGKTGEGFLSGSDLIGAGMGAGMNALMMRGSSAGWGASLMKGGKLAGINLLSGKVSSAIKGGVGGTTGENLGDLVGGGIDIWAASKFFGKMGGISSGIGLGSELLRRNVTQPLLGQGAGAFQGLIGATAAGAAFGSMGGPVGTALGALVGGGMYTIGEGMGVGAGMQNDILGNKFGAADVMNRVASRSYERTNEQTAAQEAKRMLGNLKNRESTLVGMEETDKTKRFKFGADWFSKRQFGEAEGEELYKTRRQQKLLSRAIESGDNNEVLRVLQNIQSELAKQSRELAPEGATATGQGGTINSNINIIISVKDYDKLPGQLNQSLIDPLMNLMRGMYTSLGDLANQKNPKPAQVAYLGR